MGHVASRSTTGRNLHNVNTPCSVGVLLGRVIGNRQS